MKIHLVCRYNFLEAKHTNFSFPASTLGNSSRELLKLFYYNCVLNERFDHAKKIKIFVVVFDVESVLLVFSKPFKKYILGFRLVRRHLIKGKDVSLSMSLQVNIQ